jgi:muramoyltetrapeptide carboxypeptidase LdcA involved in peptidoglycan recycling
MNVQELHEKADMLERIAAMPTSGGQLTNRILRDIAARLRREADEMSGLSGRDRLPRRKPPL